MPESFFVVSKNYLELAIDELIAIAKIYDEFCKIKIISNIVIIQSKTNWEKIAERATFVKIAGRLLRKMSGLFLDKENFKMLSNANTYVCRTINLSSQNIDVTELEKTMGDIISKFTNAKVELEDPEIIIYPYLYG